MPEERKTPISMPPKMSERFSSSDAPEVKDNSSRINDLIKEGEMALSGKHDSAESTEIIKETPLTEAPITPEPLKEEPAKPAKVETKTVPQPKKKASNRKPSSWSHPKMRWRRFISNWPFLVWLMAIAACFYIYTRGSQFGGMAGTVDTVAEPIAPIETARLLSINVILGQRVEAGAVLAQLDTSLVDAAIAQTEAEMFEQQSSIGNFERSALTIYKTFEDAIKNAESAIEDLKRRSARDAAQLKQLEIEQARLDSLFKKKLINAKDANLLKPQIVALRYEVQAYPALIKIEKSRLSDANKGNDDLAKSLRLKKGEDIKDAIARRAEAQRKIFESSKLAIDIQRQNYTLRSTRGGVVSRIFHQPGNVVPAGDPILRIVHDKPQHVIGFLPEVHLSRLHEGQKVFIWSKTRSGKKLTGTVESIAPEVDTLPARVTPISGQSLRGRRILVKISGEHDLIPGETVQITRSIEWKSILL